MKTKASAYQSWDDLVFENRNKEYGAYELRRTYPERLFLGLLFALSVVGIVRFLPSDKIADKPQIIDIIGDHVFDLPPIIEIVRPQRPQQQPAARVENSTLPPRVVSDPVETLPTVDEPVEPIASTTGVEGGSTNGSVTGIETGVDAPGVETVAPEFYLNPEVYPQYENGAEGMVKYLQKNLKYPAVPRRLGIQGTVFVSFIVNGDGSVSNVEVVRGIHPDCDREAVRVISKMNGWTGGKQAGNPVRVKMVLPIKFKLN